MQLLNFLEIGIRAIRIEALVAPHEGHQVLRLRQVDDIMRIARYHLHHLHLVAAHLELDHLLRADFPHLDQAMAAHHHEFLVLRVMPMLPFCNARPRYVHRELPPVRRADDLRKATPVIHVHS